MNNEQNTIDSVGTFITLPNMKTQADQGLTAIDNQVKEVVKKQDIEYMTACKRIIMHKNNLMKDMYKLCKSRDADYKQFALQKYCTNELEINTLRKDASYFYKKCNQLKETIRQLHLIIQEKDNHMESLKKSIKTNISKETSLCYTASRLISYLSNAISSNDNIKHKILPMIDTLKKLETPLPFKQLTVILDELNDKNSTSINPSIHYHQSMIDKRSRMHTKALHRSINYSTTEESPYSTIISAQSSNIAQLKKKLSRAQRNNSSKYFQTSELENVFIECIEETKKCAKMPVTESLQRCSDMLLKSKVLHIDEKIAIAASFICNDRILRIIYEALFPKRSVYNSYQTIDTTC